MSPEVFFLMNGIFAVGKVLDFQFFQEIIGF